MILHSLLLSYIVNGVIVPKSCSEVVQSLSVQDAVESVRANVVSDHPPGHRHHPQDQHHHHKDVIHQVAAKLTETPSHMITAVLSVLDISCQLVQTYSDDQEDGES